MLVLEYTTSTGSSQFAQGSSVAAIKAAVREQLAGQPVSFSPSAIRTDRLHQFPVVQARLNAQ